jgi:glucose/mannose-6-phosphate isomerase
MDDIAGLIERLDTQGMLGNIIAMADHLEEGVSIGQNVELREIESETFNAVVLSGMGGSAIAGDIVRSYLSGKIQIPFLVQRHYRLPEFVNRKTLVICSSYSGNTEETLSAYDDAISKGAKLIVMTTGGELNAKAGADKVPVARIPNGLPPRAALGYSFAPLLTIISRLGLCDPPADDIHRAAAAMRDRLKQCLPESENNACLDLAKKIHGTIPVIYAEQDHLDAVAWRFKGQISENAGCLAFVSVFPESNHNELVGWDELYGLDKKLTIIMLRDSQDHRRIRARMDIVSQYLEAKGYKVVNLKVENGEGLTKIFLWIQYVDFVSYYLALLNGVNPTPVEPIDYLKEKLSKID